MIFGYLKRRKLYRTGKFFNGFDYVHEFCLTHGIYASYKEKWGMYRWELEFLRYYDGYHVMHKWFFGSRIYLSWGRFKPVMIPLDTFVSAILRKLGLVKLINERRHRIFVKYCREAGKLFPEDKKRLRYE